MRLRAHRFLLPSLASLLSLTLAFACGTQEVSIPDVERVDANTGRDGATDAALTDAAVADSTADAPDVVCPEVLPDDATGVYVGPAGTIDVSCGTRAMPCKTVNVGITHAVAASKAKVYVLRGTYVERVALAAGVEVIGGWDVPAGSTKWRRTCVTPGEIVVLRAPPAQNVTVEARDLGGEATLSLVRVESKVAAQVTAGESLYGVVAVGSGTTLVMNDVHVEVGAAGAGTSPPKAATGAAGALSCSAGAGGPGAAGTAGAGAPFGAFDSTGYTPASSAAGNLGTAGNNGLPGGAGACITCGTCDTFLNGCAFLPDPVQTCGKDGQPGCAGGPGAVGAAATGGGSSIGVYVWNATVTVNGGTIKSGDAGSGGASGAGGNGGAPSAPAAGAASDACVTACALGAAACIQTTAKAAGGVAGGAAGLGGAGGNGGGGGGGSSFALYSGGVGIVNQSGPTLGHGKAGAGGGVGAAAGASGAAADHVP